ncbi:Fc.00g034370.m01.CDS01 [Cosmosporella sp. VM-42]
MSANTNHSHKVADELALKELLLRELAILHKNDDVGKDQLLKIINDSYVDHHAHDWSTHHNIAGAFAIFGPRQFISMWPEIIQSSGDVVIVGECASPHHAWVVGALESVVHGLHAWMRSKVPSVPELQHAIDILTTYESGNSFVTLPPHIDQHISKWHSLIGMVSREKHRQNMGKSGVATSLASIFAHFDSQACNVNA